MNRNRFLYFLLIIFALLLGLASRHFEAMLPLWVNLYLGDALWALMVFLLLGFVFRRKESSWIALAALLFSYSIEVSQMYHATWIDAIRATRLGGWVLGFGFLWSDIISYTAGIGFGFAMEFLLSNRKQKL
jgi:hypothetical protein